MNQFADPAIKAETDAAIWDGQRPVLVAIYCGACRKATPRRVGRIFLLRAGIGPALEREMYVSVGGFEETIDDDGHIERHNTRGAATQTGHWSTLSELHGDEFFVSTYRNLDGAIEFRCDRHRTMLTVADIEEFVELATASGAIKRQRVVTSPIHH